ncbi:MAG: hypothetical protein IRZ32_11235 [Solirubrobacteraceae bacterium]|nr:hypothetical protein [Solirubrobacteraceae bacterium]
MYQFSRVIYRELAPYIDDSQAPVHGPEAHAAVLRACEATMERLANDRHYFARPARTLFNDIRVFFPMSQQARVCQTVTRVIALAEEWLDSQPRRGFDINGNPLQCRATTRKGTPCQRMPLPRNGYCPSHQHLAETEEPAELVAA